MEKCPKLSLCRCRSHCRTLNQVSGLYERSGFWIPHSTRDQHVKDDRRLFQTGRMIGLRKSKAGPSRKAIEGKITLLCNEIQWLSKSPTSSLNLAFIFLHDLISTGIFIMPSEKNDPLHSGSYALRPNHPANRSFLWAQDHYYSMIKTINFLKNEYLTSYFELEDIEQTIFEKLRCWNGEKAFQWAQQWAHISSHCAVLVNTGNIRIYL